MNQIDLSTWQEFEKEQKQTKKKLEAKVSINNSNKQPRGEWTRKIVKQINISSLANERGITSCPGGHALYFDDSQGFFCCTYVKFNIRPCFSGNIVDITE